MSSGSTLTEILINGISRGAIYALVALGYTMVYGVLGMINFAHGEIFMIGMFSCVYAMGIFSVRVGQPGRAQPRARHHRGHDFFRRLRLRQ